MKKRIAITIVTCLLGTAAFSVPVQAQTNAPGATATFTLSSNDVKQGFRPAQIFNSFGCTGGNVSPHLTWSGAPQGTQSFVVTVYDPDAPTGSGWWHWVMFNIPASTTTLATGVSGTAKLPAGVVEGRTDFGVPGYGGPCPPAGDKAHRYVFTVHALKIGKLDLDAQASAALVGFMTNANRLASATFTATYGR